MGILGNSDNSDIDLSKQMVERALCACTDAKAFDISVLDVSEAFQLSDYFLVVSGRSDRQVQGITNRVLKEMEQLGYEPSSIEGFDEGHWVLIDFQDIVVHVFYHQTREKYDIEGLWARARRLEVNQDNTGHISLEAA
jgi:ribosome-associated protein